MEKKQEPCLQRQTGKKEAQTIIGKMWSHRPSLKTRWHWASGRTRFYCPQAQSDKCKLPNTFHSRRCLSLCQQREVCEKMLQTPLSSSAGGSMASAWGYSKCFHIDSFSTLQESSRQILVIFPLTGRKLRHREVRYSAHDHRGKKWWNQDLNSDCLVRNLYS